VIPRIIHQIWLGPDPMPREFEPYVATWKRHHPAWEHRMWTEENLPADPVRPEVLERLRAPTERADILRLDLLYRYGGIYVDTDLECLRPIDDTLGDEPFCGTYLKPGRVTNTFVAAEPGHPILERALQELVPREVHGFDKEVAGPPFLDRLLRDYPEVRLLDPALLFPATEQERAQAIAIHHMARAWKDADGLRKSMVRAEERLAKAMAKLEDERRRHAATKKRLAEAEARLKGDDRADADAEPGKRALRSRLGGLRRST
jgi:mannosyltransferase OCH1-like enzyme